MAVIVIAGGGIGGLATALAVAAGGHRAVVLERADRFAEIGAGIQLAPNGLDALDALGVGAEVRGSAVHMDELRFMDGVTGEHVTSLELTADYRRRFAGPYVVVHRAELHQVLLDACLAAESVDLVAGATVTGYEQDERGATVALADGRRITGAAVIGADGIHSAIRRQLVADGEPRVSGITVYRAVIPMERVPDRLRFARSVVWWAGPGCHFVHYPIAGGRYLNLAASSDDGSTEAFAGVPVRKERVRREFTALGAAPRELLELGDDWKTWMLVDRDPVLQWTEGRVALLGDAAHPMLHYAAQGACQALEDAVVLGALLEGTTNSAIPGRLTAYVRLRRERTARIQRIARDSTRLWHPAGAAATARNAMLAALSPEQLRDHVAWMHGFRVAQPGKEVAA
ncbi:FAD-dependent monooxygenase [Amycolatopsis cihanbeyliensis]|uniref:Salicylate hydroxylase n=1 Tax=Amycolatopsis cihanbeyliensis TaxID=1128664 RepID=A0A542DPY2_AMYCI|nr:FAD-dependent monooxygenase [Amycolatopsis cihanbeyliensis]TQJ05159.1 salicylate hydroxylase [Amycolatopsis cihanbeyliensis]